MGFERSVGSEYLYRTKNNNNSNPCMGLSLRSQTMIQLEHLPFNDLIPWNIKNNAARLYMYAVCNNKIGNDGEPERSNREIKTICTESTEQING